MGAADTPRRANIEDDRAKTYRLACQYPDHYPAGKASLILNMTKRNLMVTYRHKLKHMLVEGIYLYEKNDVHSLAVELETKRQERPVAVWVKGLEAERLQEICAQYYRRFNGIGDIDLLKLAKEISEGKRGTKRRRNQGYR
jgi:hypothetical protein